jgi:hypothetical protein
MKYVPGLLAGQLSGGAGSTVASHNRAGSYFRTKVTPTNPNTVLQAQRRAKLTALAQAYRGLTEAQRSGWAALGGQISRLDALGHSYTLTGLQAYELVNFYRGLAGQLPIADAPVLSAAPALDTLTLTGSATVPALSLAYTPTPLGAGQRLLIYASPQVSAGINFFGDVTPRARGSKGLYKLLSVTAAAAASPANLLASYTTKFGTLVVGKKISVAALPLSADYEPGVAMRADVILA